MAPDPDVTWPQEHSAAVEPEDAQWTRARGTEEVWIVQRCIGGVSAPDDYREELHVCYDKGRNAMDSNAKESQRTLSNSDMQRLCSGGVIEPGSVRTSTELKMFTAGINSLMVAAGEESVEVLAGRETSSS